VFWLKNSQSQQLRKDVLRRMLAVFLVTSLTIRITYSLFANSASTPFFLNYNNYIWFIITFTIAKEKRWNIPNSWAYTSNPKHPGQLQKVFWKSSPVS
jgi:uncharacterized membrane protein